MKNGSTKRFWFALAIINLLALGYPLVLLFLARNTGPNARLGALLVLIGCVLLLSIVNFVCVCIVQGDSTMEDAEPHGFTQLSTDDAGMRR